MSSANIYVNSFCGREDSRHRANCGESTNSYDTLSGASASRCNGKARFHLNTERGVRCLNLCRSHAQKYRRHGLSVVPIDLNNENNFWRWYVYSSPLTFLGYFWLLVWCGVIIAAKLH